MADLQLLLVRPADLLVLELQLTNVDLVDPGMATMRVAVSEASTISVIVPPQAVLEEMAVGSAASAVLSGPSRLTIEWPAGTDLPLGRDAFVQAIGGAMLRPSPFTESGATLIEVPWGILMSPVGAASLGSTAQPSAAADGTTGTWRVDVGDANTGWHITAGRENPPTLAGETPLQGQRKLLEQASEATPVLGVVRLGAAGATARLTLNGASEEWRHDIALGRDQAVTLQQHGMLYPWGFRALQTESWKRVTVPDGSGSASGLVRTELRITLLERVAQVSRADFPFDRVETTADVIEFSSKLHVAEAPFHFKGPLAAEVEQLNKAIAERTEAINQRLRDVPRNMDEMIEQGLGSGSALGEAREAAGAAAEQLARGEAAIREADRRLGPLQRRLDKIHKQMRFADESTLAELAEQESAINAQIQELNANLPNPSAMEAFRVQFNATESQRQRLEQICEAELASFPRTIDALRAIGDGEVGELDMVAAKAADAAARLQLLTATLESAREISFMPAGVDGLPIAMPLRFSDERQRLDAEMPCLFVNDFTLNHVEHSIDFRSLVDKSTTDALETNWSTYKVLQANDIVLDLVRRPPAEPGDIHQLRQCDVVGRWQGDHYMPGLGAIKVRLPALAMAIPGSPEVARLSFALDDDAAPLRIIPPLPISFAGAGERSGGLVLPSYDVDAIARTTGPVPLAAIGGATPDDAKRIFGETKLLGYSLADLTGAGGNPIPAPEIVPTSTGAKFEWNGVKPGSFPGFTAHPDCTLSLRSEVEAGTLTTRAELTDFELSLPPGASLVDVGFAGLVCTIQGGRAPKIEINGLTLHFRNELALLEDLRRRVSDAVAATGSGIVLEQLPAGVRAGYRLRLPDVAAGAFILRGVAAAVLVTIPFDGNPVEVEVSFARPDNPFALAVLMFGGGGYATVTLRAGKLAKVDVSLNFGAMIGVDFKIVKADVSVTGGLRLLGGEDGYSFDAFLRFSGQINLLGVVSVSVSLRLLLSYRENSEVVPGKRMLIGRATLVLEIDVLFLSKSLELDSGEWVIEGSPIEDNRARRAIDGPKPFIAVTSLPAAAANRLRIADRAGRQLVHSHTAEAWSAYTEAFE